MDEKLYRAGEVAKRTGISRKTLHAYVQMGIVREARRTASGYRLYDESVFRRLNLIKRLQATGYSLQQIRETFLSKGETAFGAATGSGDAATKGGSGGGGISGRGAALAEMEGVAARGEEEGAGGECFASWESGPTERGGVAERGGSAAGVGAAGGLGGNSAGEAKP